MLCQKDPNIILMKMQHNKAKSEGQILHFLRKYSSNVRKFYIDIECIQYINSYLTDI